MAAVGDGTSNPTQFTVSATGNATFGAVSVGAASINADSEGDGTAR